MKFLALYLPQFHEIEDNNIWWGEGYTEWTAVKRAVPLYKGHSQPNIPLDNNYYDLAEESASTWRWQADLAKKYGIYGFCIYHYWFGEKQLLQKPMEILLNHNEIDLKYCICWANETWTRTWYDKSEEILVHQTYGDKNEWKRHYDYLRQFFLDKRYIRNKNKPLLHIYRQEDIECLDEMLQFWNKLSILDGFSGIDIVVSKNSLNNVHPKSDLITGFYNFEPGYSTRNGLNIFERIEYFGKIGLRHCSNLIFKTKNLERMLDIRKINKRIIKNYKRDLSSSALPIYIGVCPKWDNTPRRGFKGSVYYNATPEEFLSMLYKIKKIVKNDEDFVYINAWNEWGEGCYLEPDTRFGYSFLEAIKTFQTNQENE